MQCDRSSLISYRSAFSKELNVADSQVGILQIQFNEVTGLDRLRYHELKTAFAEHEMY